ncbi:MAG: hypothetical protein A2138_04480 [Deltaproteobacteria bacterium RBG_16_71_12]|nr:MAG: hypothetical protein A2138_04480 [Deltaproteobacteria bacterium RBG_16_71_12]
MRARRLVWVALLAIGCGTTSTVTGPLPPSADARAGRAEPGDDDPPRDVSPEAYRAVLEAELKMQGGDLAGGVALLREAALQDPRSSYLRVRLAEASLEGGDVEQARDAAEEALRLSPRSAAALVVLAQAQRLAGDGEAAERTLARLLAIDAAHRDGSLLLAELRVERGDVRGAEQVIEALMQREPGAVDGYIALARVFAERGDVERAFRHADHALEREGDDPDALGLKLTLLFARGEVTLALPVARALAAAAGDGALVRRDLLAALALAGDVGGAEQLARAWLDDDASEDMRLLVASAWQRIGELEHAARALEPTAGVGRSPRLAAEHGHALLLLRRPAQAADAACPLVGAPATAEVAGYLLDTCVRALVRAGRAAEAATRVAPLLPTAGAPLLDALAVVGRAGALPAADVKAAVDAVLTRNPADVETVTAAARAHEELGDVARARAVLDDALRARPHDAELLFALARHLERNGQAAAAVEIVERLIDRGAPDIDTLNFVAFTLADQRTRGDDARRLAWRALVQDPLNGYVVDTLGWAERAAGALEEARATLARADRLSPGEGEILYHRAVVELELGAVELARALAARAQGTLEPGDPAVAKVDALLVKLGSKS